jgi:adenine-specific DNA-methyltransferase
MNTETFGVKYIGSKASLIPHILKCIDENVDEPISSAIDVFTGTTRVAQAFKRKGWTVQTSDLSWASASYSGTWIEGPVNNTHLLNKIDFLNKLQGVEGWITKNYCDVKGVDDAIVRVWQPKNGKKADAIRDQIETWWLTNEISNWEKDTLVTSLILALDKVDNTVGVQQAYLKSWCARSNNDLLLELPKSVPGSQGNHKVGDCLTLSYEKADLAYLDPPYSTHSYSTYYHIWDSIAEWDKPDVGLKTNRRVDRISGHGKFDDGMSSSWNNKKSALAAFEKLIDRLPVKWVLVSYNNESLVPIEKLQTLLKKYPKVITTKVDYKRNIMSQIGNAAKDKPDDAEFKTENVEYLFLIKKGETNKPLS